MRQVLGGAVFVVMLACSRSTDATAPGNAPTTTVVLTNNLFSALPSQVRAFDVPVPGPGTVRVTTNFTYPQSRTAVVVTGTSCFEPELAFTGQCEPMLASQSSGGTTNRLVLEFRSTAATTVRVWIANQDVALQESGTLEVTYTND